MLKSSTKSSAQKKPLESVSVEPLSISCTCLSSCAAVRSKVRVLSVSTLAQEYPTLKYYHKTAGTKYLGRKDLVRSYLASPTTNDLLRSHLGLRALQTRNFGQDSLKSFVKNSLISRQKLHEEL